ncbi:MAG: chloride channel protein [Bdellovibrionaceae bacterium]|nr:chloride channel protein [Pseudobdellovibrionaceae bacterium]
MFLRMNARHFLHNSHVADFQRQILFNLPFWTAAGLTALISVVYNKLFGLCEEWALDHAASSLILWTAPVALLASFLIGHFFSREALGSGIPQVIAAAELANEAPAGLRKLLGLRMLAAKIVGSCVCVLGGGVTGREGPTLQVSASVFYQLSRVWPKRFTAPSLQGMILAGGAAGLASAFNTPLGGIVFVIEELSKAHISVIRTSVFQAVIIAGILAQLFLGNYLYLGHVSFGSFPLEALAQTALIAAVVGFLGSGFAELLYRITRWRAHRSFRVKIAMTLLCGLLLSASIAVWPTTVGAGKTTMVKLLEHPEAPASLSLSASRMLGNFLTYNAGVIGGVFAPSLSSGAALGQWIAQTLGFASVKLMILVGMVAFLAGLTRSPFTSFVLVLEMSNSHDIILYLMLASLFANLAARFVGKESFYERAAHDILKAHVPAAPRAEPST